MWQQWLHWCEDTANLKPCRGCRAWTASSQIALLFVGVERLAAAPAVWNSVSVGNSNMLTHFFSFWFSESAADISCLSQKKKELLCRMLSRCRGCRCSKHPFPFISCVLLPYIFRYFLSMLHYSEILFVSNSTHVSQLKERNSNHPPQWSPPV